MPTVHLQVNGASVRVDVEARTLLVELLREHMGLTGTHVGCDTSQCGACVVHVDGRSVKSCTMFAVEADGASVTTIEGVARDGELHPLQAAFRENHALQCGFCTPGMIMAVRDLLRDNPNPSEDEIREGIEGNLCRCTGYQNIVADNAKLLATAHNGFSQRQNILGIEALRQKGMDVYVPSLDELEAFKKISQPPALKFVEEKAGKEWVTKILKAVAEAEQNIRIKK